MPSTLPLLVVDGYNVIYGTPRYASLIDDADTGTDTGADADKPVRTFATTADRVYASDPFERAREALTSDVATYAQGRFDPIIVFDAAGNLASERPRMVRGGVRLVFSRTGESGDTAIERLVTRARNANRSVLLVTSDNTIRYTVGGIPVTVVSSALLASDIEIVEGDVAAARTERAHTHMTLASRLPADQRERLRHLLDG